MSAFQAAQEKMIAGLLGAMGVSKESIEAFAGGIATSIKNVEMNLIAIRQAQLDAKAERDLIRAALSRLERARLIEKDETHASG